MSAIATGAEFVYLPEVTISLATMVHDCDKLVQRFASKCRLSSTPLNYPRVLQVPRKKEGRGADDGFDHSERGSQQDIQH